MCRGVVNTWASPQTVYTVKKGFAPNPFKIPCSFLTLIHSAGYISGRTDILMSCFLGGTRQRVVIQIKKKPTGHIFNQSFFCCCKFQEISSACLFLATCVTSSTSFYEETCLCGLFICK